MKLRHRLEAWLAGGALSALRALPLDRSRRTGAALGAAMEALGVRRAVAEDNLARAFPERAPAERRAILSAHYRELGRVFAEYARLPELARGSADGVAEVRGLEHLLSARERGRGVILLTGHFSHFELLGASLARWQPVDFVVRPLSNPATEGTIARLRAAAGVGSIDAGAGVKGVFRSLAANHWVAMLADQDARRRGVFVPFLGRPASTPIGPARIALRSGAPIVMGFGVRREDGRIDLEIEPELEIADRDAPDAALRLTALHTARLEHWVRRFPHLWFWLHRRWKTAPPDALPI